MILCLETKMNLDVQKVFHWCMANRMNLNPTKSNYFIISPKLRETSLQISLTLHYIYLSTSKSVQNLVVHLDSQLNFQDHITATAHKIS